MDEKKRTFKIVFLVFVAFVITLSMLYVINDWYLSENDNEKIQNPLFSKNFDSNEKNKIYVMGNSRVKALNTDLITNHLQESGYDYKVFNLGVSSTKPLDRLRVLDTIISTNPKLVLFGLDFQDIQDEQYNARNENIFQKPLNPLLDPQEYFKKLIPSGKMFGIDFYNFKNPKLTSLQVIDNFFIENKIEETATDPFLRPPTNEVIDNFFIEKKIEETVPDPFLRPPTNEVLDKEHMEELLKIKWYFKGTISSDNIQLDALKEIIQTLNENEIEAVIFTVPRPQSYLDTIPIKEKENYENLLADIKSQVDVEIYFLHEKYAELEIFSDPSHVTRNLKKGAAIYSEGIGEIILEEFRN